MVMIFVNYSKNTSRLRSAFFMLITILFLTFFNFHTSKKITIFVGLCIWQDLII